MATLKEIMTREVFTTTGNVSVAEVGDQDLWQKAVLGIACVANEAPS